jgi:hypothetical protein
MSLKAPSFPMRLSSAPHGDPGEQGDDRRDAASDTLMVGTFLPRPAWAMTMGGGRMPDRGLKQSAPRASVLPGRCGTNGAGRRRLCRLSK